MSTRELLLESVTTGEPVVVNLLELVHTLDGTSDWGWKYNTDDRNNLPHWLPNIIAVKIIDDQMSYLIESILEHGFTMPINIVFDYNNEGEFVTGNGHHRFVAALLCGMTEIPVIVSDGDLDFESSEGEEEEDFFFDTDSEMRKAFWEIHHDCVKLVEELNV